MTTTAMLMEAAPGRVPEGPEDGRVPEGALRELYDRHGRTLLCYLVRLTRGDRHRAEDILQETLLRAWRHPQARQADGAWSLPWLFTVARRITIDQARAASARPTELGDDRLVDRPQECDDYQRMIDADEVRRALATLPDRLRDVLVEVYFRERSVAEASSVLDVPPGTIKSRTYYALRELRAVLRARGF